MINIVMKTKERLKLFVQSLNMGQNAFEAEVGIANGYLASKSQSVNSDAIEKIIIKYPSLNLDWLFTGNGDMSLGEEAKTLRREKNISIESITNRHSVSARIINTLIFLLTLPYTVSVSILSLPMVLICKFIFTLLKDPAFKNSIRFLIYLLLWPILMIVYSIIICSQLPCLLSIITIILLLPAPIIAHTISRAARIIISDIRLLKTKRLRELHKQIREIVKR